MTNAFTPVARLDELPLEHFSKGRSYASDDVAIGAMLGLRHLGAGYCIVPPGKTSCPFHVHHAEDEMFVILAGSGEYRFGDKRYQVQAGDVLGAPVGGAEFAHQLWNIGDEPLKYLAISSKADTDVCEYPDTGKFSVSSRHGNADMQAKRTFRVIGREESSLDYFDGDKDA